MHSGAGQWSHQFVCDDRRPNASLLPGSASVLSVCSGSNCVDAAKSQPAVAFGPDFSHWKAKVNEDSLNRGH